jgi:HD domain
VATHLLPGELALWHRMSGPDRRHAVGVAERVERALGHEASRPVLAAALLHDIGKVESGLGTYGRVVATVSAKVAGHDMAATWRKQRGVARRVGLYLHHEQLGGDLLELAGSDPLTVTWTREHHLPPSDWTIQPDIAAALHAADDG